MSHAYTDDPDAPDCCRVCFLPRANKRHLGGVAVPLAGAAWPTPEATVESEQERIKQGIRLAATKFGEFSADDARALTPGPPIVNTKLYGSEYGALIRAKEITSTGKRVASEHPATKGHAIYIYRRGPRLQKPRVTT